MTGGGAGENPLNQSIAEATRWVARAESIAVLTGAGISAESGVPTFRGADGLWRNHRAEELATPEAFARNPKLVWEWYRYRQGLINATRPNRGHEALARLEGTARRFTLVTQNVDGHHARAGSRRIIELHGNIYRARCPVDGELVDLTGEEEELIPRCGAGHSMRPDVVWFGEALPAAALGEAWDAAGSCELFLLVGTSALVQPAATLPVVAARSGARVVEINPEETPLSGGADLSLRGTSGEILPRLIAAEVD